jgi:hypothetical protein
MGAGIRGRDAVRDDRIVASATGCAQAAVDEGACPLTRRRPVRQRTTSEPGWR